MAASTAVRWASFLARGRPGRPGRRSAAASDRPGQPFLPGIFGSRSRIVVAAAIGADLAADETTWNWIDLTALVYHPPKIIISQGRSDNTSTAQPGTCALTFVNDNGDLTPYNPRGVWWPNMRRGTPLRVSVDLDTGTGPVILYQGNIASFTPSWDTSAKLPLMAVVAGGVTRRLSQGKSPARSAMTTTLLGADTTDLVALWTLEEDSTATQGASSVPGGRPLVSVGQNQPAFGADGAPGGAASLDMAGFPVLHGPVPGCLATSWWVGFAMATPIVAGQFLVPMGWYDSTGAVWLISTAVASTFQVAAVTRVDADGLSSFGGGSGFLPSNDGGFHYVQVTAVQNGPDILTAANVDDVGWVTFPIAGRTLGAITYFAPGAFTGYAGQISDYRISHLAVRSPSVINPATPDTGGAVAGYAGETAVDRLIRVAREQAITISVDGTSNITMGAQQVSKPIDTLREGEAADLGVIYDGFGSGIAYHSRSAGYNQPAAFTLDASAGQIAPPFQPVDDDQRLRNDATASRSGGGSPRQVTDVTGPNGVDAVGAYDTSLTVNVDTDDLLDDIAGWVVRLGTVEGLRYPSLTLDLAATPALAPQWLGTGRGIGWRLDVTNVDTVATQHPPDDVRLVVEGWTMTLDPVGMWKVAVACSPFDPFVVPVVGDPVLGKLGTASTTQHDGWDGVSATFTVDTATGPLWSTDSAQYPVDINCSGQRVTISGCSGAGNPQTLTVSDPSVNGVSKPHPPGEAVTLWLRLRPAL